MKHAPVLKWSEVRPPCILHLGTKMKVTCGHTLADLSVGKEPLVSIEEEVRLSPGPFPMFLQGITSLVVTLFSKSI